MKRVVSRGREVPELNLTSMIDVIFLLLIFFVFTTNFNEIEKFLPMNLSLPGKTNAAERPPLPEKNEPEPLRLELLTDSEGQMAWRLDGTEYENESELTGALRLRAEQNRETRVLIDPADSASVEQVLDLYGLCRETGLTNVQFKAGKPAPSP